jgi:bifunctional UDP-N-acetylglucosamine pyrophosphorylase/glucosamine-1-phosphate N-acetyltransferase
MLRRPLLFIILAAGKGTRMQSAIPKVLHKIAGRSLLGHAITLGREADRIAVVVGPDSESVAAEARNAAPNAEIFIQPRQLGTGDAVLAARPAIERHQGDVVVLFADTPLVTAGTLERLLATLAEEESVAVLAFESECPSGN